MNEKEITFYKFLTGCLLVLALAWIAAAVQCNADYQAANKVEYEHSK